MAESAAGIPGDLRRRKALRDIARFGGGAAVAATMLTAFGVSSHAGGASSGRTSAQARFDRSRHGVRGARPATPSRIGSRRCGFSEVTFDFWADRLISAAVRTGTARSCRKTVRPAAQAWERGPPAGRTDWGASSGKSRGNSTLALLLLLVLLERQSLGLVILGSLGRGPATIFEPSGAIRRRRIAAAAVSLRRRRQWRGCWWCPDRVQGDIAWRQA